MSIWIVNDLLTCIPGTRTFWHLLLEIDGTIDKTGVPFNKLAGAIENDPDECDLIIRNGTFFREIQRDDCKQVSLIQDYYGYDHQQIEVAANADAVVFNSEFTKSKFKDVPWKDYTVPIGVDQNLFKPMANFRPANDIFERFKRT